MTDGISDSELVRQSLAGRTAAYEQLVRRWAARVTAFCHARVRHADAAEDLAQEALMRSYRALPTLLEPERFGTWLHGIAHRACLDWLKSKARTQVSFSALGSNGNGEEFPDARAAQPESASERADELRRLMAGVEALPDEYREVVMLYYYDDVTYRDLAELLGVSAATINARLTKARKLLRARMAECRR